jgi:hypothetical protein
MPYFVVADDGAKYGPADLETLNSWIKESRLLAATLLEDDTSGARIAAGSVPGLNFPSARATEGAAPPVGVYSNPNANRPAPHNPYSANFANQAPVDSEAGKTENLIAWILGGVGLVFCGLGWLLGGIGAVLGYQAKSKGHPGGNASFIFNIVVVVVSLVVIIGYFAIVVPMAAKALQDMNTRTGTKLPPGVSPFSVPQKP